MSKIRFNINKKLISAVLVTFFVLSAMPLHAFAEERFSDVHTTDWFYDDVEALAQQGIISGYPDGSFMPDETITEAEFIKLIVAASEVDIPSDETGEWFAPFISAARNYGMIEKNDDISPDSPIKRSKMAAITVRALGCKPNSENPQPFIDENDQYATTAYNEYLIRGYPTDDGKREFRGQAFTKRSEAAAMISRVIDYLSDPALYRDRQILKEAETYPVNSESELIGLFISANRTLSGTFTFKTDLSINRWQSIYLRTQSQHPELFLGTAISYSYYVGTNKYTITVEYPKSMDDISAMIKNADNSARKFVAERLSSSMTTAEMLRIIHNGIITGCRYEYEGYITGNVPYSAYTAYGALVDGRAVCQGYCAAFNLICSYAGISSLSVSGTAPDNDDNHCWNAVLMPDGIRFIDVTFDDPVPDRVGRAESEFFMLTEDEFYRLGYRWDATSVNESFFK